MIAASKNTRNEIIIIIIYNIYPGNFYDHHIWPMLFNFIIFKNDELERAELQNGPSFTMLLYTLVTLCNNCTIKR